jgi:OmpA-OmpF porin, OOP family
LFVLFTSYFFSMSKNECQCGVKSSIPWWLLGLLGLWLAFGAYWHTCLIKGLCSRPNIPVVSVPLPSGTGSVWEKLSVEPLTVYFGINNNDVISEGVQPELEKIVAYLKENPTARITVTGHTNHFKNDQGGYTQKLGLARADKMKEYLVKLGAPASSITLDSRGQSEVVSGVSDTLNHWKNRRAVISVSK